MPVGSDDPKAASSEARLSSSTLRQISSELKQISSDLKQISSEIKHLSSGQGLTSGEVRLTSSDDKLGLNDSKIASINRKAHSKKRKATVNPTTSSVEARPAAALGSYKQSAIKLYALCLCALLSLLIYVCAIILTYDSFLTKPYDPEAPELNDILQAVYRSLTPLRTFRQFRYYIQHTPTISQGFCIGLTSVVCEKFLASVPQNTSYQSFIDEARRLFPDFPTYNHTEITVWDWDPLTQPFELVRFDHDFTYEDLTMISACVRAVQDARKVLDFPYEVIDPVKKRIPRFTLGSARFLSVGACRLAQLSKFEDRAELLWQLCLVGCGAAVDQGERGGIDWSTICDVFLFISSDIRALHQCPYQQRPTTECEAVVVRALDWCGLSLLLEDAQDDVITMKPP